MKKVSLWMLVCFFSATLSAFAGEPMRMVYFDNYQPFSWMNANRKMQGILIDILDEAIAKRMKISLIHEGYPWARAQKMVRQGKADAFATVSTPERGTYTEASNEPVMTANITLFVKKDNPKMARIKKVGSIADLKDFSLISYLGAGWEKKNFKGFDVTWADNLDMALKMLAKGRCDIFAQTSKVALFNIRKQEYVDQIIEIPDVTLDSVDFKLCVGKKSPHADMLPEFDKVMREVRTDGTLEKIYDKYK